jgi:hypothetical protein
MSNLWGNKELTFHGNDYLTPLTVRHDFAAYLEHPQGAKAALQADGFKVITVACFVVHWRTR